MELLYTDEEDERAVGELNTGSHAHSSSGEGSKGKAQIYTWPPCPPSWVVLMGILKEKLWKLI